MLIEFRVKNYGCLRDEQALSFVPASNDPTLLESNTFETGVPSVPRLLRTAVLYGPMQEASLPSCEPFRP